MKNKFLLYGLIAVALVVAFFIYRSTLFRLIDTNPKRNTTDMAISAPVQFVFSKEVAATDSLTIEISPPQDGTIAVAGKTVTVQTGLKYYTDYTITLKSVSSVGGKKIDSVSVRFVTGGLDLAGVEKRNQLLSTLPYTEERFSVDYTVGNRVFTVQVFSEPVEDVKRAALEFLGQHGVTEATDKIEFYIVPSVSGQAGP